MEHNNSHNNNSYIPSHTRRRSGSLVFGGAGARHSMSHVRRHSPLHEDKPVPEEPYGSDLSGATTSDDMEMEDLNSDEELTDDEETGLTHAERKKRRRRKSRNQRLDQRVAPGDDVQKAEDQVMTASFIKDTIINALLIGLWYSFSISISVYNKWMFSSENLDFHFPLFTTSVHMLVQFTLASLVLWIIPRFRPNADQGDQDGHGSYSQLNGHDTNTTIDHEPKSTIKKPLMTRSFYLTRISPCGTATALDIGLGNFSLRFITLTFFTMCKSSVLAFVLLFAFLFRLETPTWKLCAVILFMTFGVIMMVAGEASFNALGFLLVMSASFCSGFRWSLTQILLLRNAATSNPFSSIFFLTPSMFLVLFLLALPIETPTAVFEGLQTLSTAKGTPLTAVIILFPGCLAFMMVAAEFALLKRTSVVTLSVCGIFKEVLTISAASYSFGDPLSPINVSGLVVTIASIAGYNWLKYSKMRSEARKEAQGTIEDNGGGSGGSGAEETDHANGKRQKAAAENGHIAHPDTFAAGRDSTTETAGLMRDSLLATNVEPGGVAVHGRTLSLGTAGNGVLRDGQTHSPVKRPEDLE
ncbi:related to nucleotide-sugar transporter [Lecanosticta acicola]|uniref:Related to nucleotide-sugar transporter n=1 Tax=Lecanosticta acicola TaxID=111012 RepID=A0AAI8YYF2_9PEZI|nr:related to nucleotide-sugar transporter [Lecanosticta acicola]